MAVASGASLTKIQKNVATYPVSFCMYYVYQVVTVSTALHFSRQANLLLSDATDIP